MKPLAGAMVVYFGFLLWTSALWAKTDGASSPQNRTAALMAEVMPEDTGFFVGWGTLSLINAGLAQSKGRRGLLWWLASLLIGPLATMLIVVLPTEPREIR